MMGARDYMCVLCVSCVLCVCGVGFRITTSTFLPLMLKLSKKATVYIGDKLATRHYQVLPLIS